MKDNPKVGAVTVRLDQDLKDRLSSAAQKFLLSENDIARHAIRAAVTGIEANGYKIELPLELVLKKAPAESRVERGFRARIKDEPRRATGLNEPEGEYPSRKAT